MSTKRDSVRLYKIRKLISELSSKEGRGTELISLYVPPKKPVHEVISNLRDEWGTAGNIKSDTTRNHVQDALVKTMQRLKLYKTTPENGLVIFCGALPTNGPGSEVVTIHEIVPPKPVSTYLYMCVAPETKILMDDGTEKTIGELKSSWPSERVMSWDADKHSLVGSSIQDYLDAPVGGRKTYRLTVESGRSLVATEDHPFWTPKGWVRIGELKKGDLVCVLPLPDMDSRKGSARKKDSEKVILDEESLCNVSSPPKNLRLAIKRLKKRGLLPLTSQSPKLVMIARIMGHLFSDGSMTQTIEERSRGPYSYFTVDFCIGRKVDEDELRNDIAELGGRLPQGYEATYTMNVEGRAYTGHVRHAKLRDVAICTLLRALGAPIGDKVKNGTEIPRWLMEAPLTVQREFLASYFGGDGTVPRIVKRNLSSQSGVGFHRVLQKKESGMKQARQLVSLLSKFGVTVNAIDCTPSYKRNDGFETVEIRLRFKLSEDNILKLCQSIGIRYCSRKAMSVNLVGEYLRIKSHLRKETRQKMMQAQRLRAEGTHVKQIGELLMVAGTTASQWTRGRVRAPLVPTTLLPTFSEWSKIARTGLEELLLWESVTSKEPTVISDVRDLTVEDSSHSFFANGFLVHNCDDHYHLEWLKDMLKEEKVYGIISIDSTEAGLGILSGDRLEVVDVITSGVSGKTRKGGQCVSSDTIVQLEDGRLVPVSRLSPGSRIASYNFSNHTQGIYECADTFTLIPKEYCQVETVNPKLTVNVTGEHRFFTLTDGGVSTIEASGLGRGDRILVSRSLPEPANPVLWTRFPANYTYTVSLEGRESLKAMRLQRGISQPRLGAMLGVHQSEISQFERGERSLAWTKLRKIVSFLYGNVDEFLAKHVETKRALPELFTNDLLQLLGYITGDGNHSKNRITMYEQRIEVARRYSRLASKALGLRNVPILTIDKTRQRNSFAKHPYLEIRIYSKEFAEALGRCYPAVISTESREIPEQMHRLDNKHLAFFLRGLFDAEGHARSKRIGIAMKSETLIKQLQLLLMRFGIVSSYSHSVNRYGSTMHALDISDFGSLEVFYESIGFSAKDKERKLERRVAKGRARSSFLNVPVIGSWVDSRAKELGIKRRQFPGITNFFHDERGISRSVFSGVVRTFEDELARARSSNDSSERLELLQDTISQLRMIEQSELILAKVKRVRWKRNLRDDKFIDIELPVTRSFIGNGFVLHNSARRYERAREMELTYYFNRVGEHAARVFVNDTKVTGLIVGGPGPTKEDFLKGGYLHYQLQKNVLAVIDSSYAGREGVRELVEKAADTLQDVRLIEEKKLVQRFLTEVNKPGGLAIYGLPRVLDALQKAIADTVLISDDIETTKITMKCKNCGTTKERVVQNQSKMQATQEMISTPCEKCRSTDYEIHEKDIVDVLEETAFQVGAKVEVISSGTEEGNMFRSFGGVAAFLRYRPQ